MKVSNQQLWARFQKYYTEFPDLGLAIDLSRMNFADDYFAVMEPRMQKAFAAMADHGIGDPEKLAAAIGEALIATAVGVFFALPAFVFLIISIIRFRSYRARIRKQPA